MVMENNVTIAIPVYNAAASLRDTLESALAQTFADIEFLILDDCGTDGSMDIVCEMQRQHPRGSSIRIVRQPHNMGVGAARNRILDEARGRYLYFLDADDLLAPNAIELLHNEAVTHDAQLVYGSYERIEKHDDGTTSNQLCCYPDKVFHGNDDFAQYAYSRYAAIQASVWNILIDTDIIRRNKLRFQQTNYWEDFAFNMDLPSYVSRAAMTSRITYYYICHSGSLSHFQQRQTIAKQEITATIQLVEGLKQQSHLYKDRTYFAKRMAKVMMTDLYIVCDILHSRSKITPPFSNTELRDIMRSPLTLRETLALRQKRAANLSLYMLGKLPAWLAVAIMLCMGKVKHLI